MNDNLIHCLKYFGDNYDFDEDYRFSYIEADLTENYNLNDFKIDLIAATENENFDWCALFDAANIGRDGLDDNFKLKEFIKTRLFDYLFPEKIIDGELIDFLSLDLIKILSNKWIDSYDLFYELKERNKNIEFEYFNFYKIINQVSGKLLNKLEQKNKKSYIELGYFRLNPI